MNDKNTSTNEHLLYIHVNVYIRWDMHHALYLNEYLISEHQFCFKTTKCCFKNAYSFNNINRTHEHVLYICVNVYFRSSMYHDIYLNKCLIGTNQFCFRTTRCWFKELIFIQSYQQNKWTFIVHLCEWLF